MLVSLSAQVAVEWAVRSCCLARAVSLFELARTSPELDAGGVYNGSISGLMNPAASRTIRSVLQVLAAGIPNRAYRFVVAVDALAVIALFVWPLFAPLQLMCAALLAVQMNRLYMSLDGADEMTLVTLVACFIGSVGGVYAASAWFLAGEVSLSYLVAGLYKVASPHWKEGRALSTIVQTRMFGNEALAAVLRGRPRLAAGSQLITVSWECVFVAALVSPQPVALGLMALGIVFHLSCAWAMGLNSFPWAFLASYPSVLFVNRQVHGWPGAPFLALGILVAVAAAGAALYRRATFPPLAALAPQVARLID